MQVMTKEQEQLLEKLLLLAYGDPFLVERSLGLWTTPGKTLNDVIDFILAHRDEKRLPKNAA